MARGTGQVARIPIRVRERSHRTLDQRLGIRFPRLVTPLFRLLMMLSPGSRLRSAAVARTIRLAVEAYNRRDLDAVAIGFHPDVEWYPYDALAAVGLSGTDFAFAALDTSERPG